MIGRKTSSYLWWEKERWDGSRHFRDRGNETRPTRHGIFLRLVVSPQLTPFPIYNPFLLLPAGYLYFADVAGRELHGISIFGEAESIFESLSPVTQLLNHG
jgi:hypothetical protein